MAFIVDRLGKPPRLTGVRALEIRDGVVEVTILTSFYEEAGEHWRRVLSGPRHGGYRRIFIQRDGANRRRYLACYDLRGFYIAQPVNIDECPGAMFIWETKKDASIQPVLAINNQQLGRDMGIELRQFHQKGEHGFLDLWEVQFRFI